MSSKYRFFICFIFAIFGIANAADDHKMDVFIYYEILDSPSVKFFTDNFKANTSDLLKFINVHLIPFGNAKVGKSSDGLPIITCEHGEVECYGNRAHACATKLMSQPEDQMNFILCTMRIVDFKTKLDTYPIRQCVESLNNPNLNRTVLEICAATKNDQFMDTYEKNTNSVLGTAYHSLPAITFGKDQYDANLSSVFVKHFNDALCQRLGNNTGIVAICPNAVPATTVPSTTPTTTTANPGSSATVNTVTCLPLVLAIIVLFNLKLHYRA